MDQRDLRSDEQAEAKVKEETDRVDHAIHTTMDRIDGTVDRMRSNVRAKTSAVVVFVRGLRGAIRRDAALAASGVRNVNLEEVTWQTHTILSATTKAAAAVS